MAFNTLRFLLCFSVSAAVYLNLPGRMQNPFLLLCNLAFYACEAWQYLPLLAFTVLFSFWIGRGISRSESPKARKNILTAGVLVLLAVLALFKYYRIFFESWPAAIGVTPPENTFTLVYPLGLSFMTFQVIGYLVDLYNGKTEFDGRLLRHALFVTFFASTAAGPINRAGEMLGQFDEVHRFDYSRTVEALQRFLVGAFKKTVVADGCARLVNPVYSDTSGYTGWTVLLAVILYAVEIYCDFSGYTDMAHGAAQLLGFRIRENFHAPYRAISMAGFWQRWHMSLTSWLTDYVFTPLVWSRWWNRLFYRKNSDRNPAVLVNILIVFAVSGLWHGSTVNFLIWGLLHGLFRCLEEIVGSIRKKRGRGKRRKPGKAARLAGTAYVFAVSAFTHVFFRASTLLDAVTVLRNLLRECSPKLFRDQVLAMASAGFSNTNLFYLFFFGCLTLGILASGAIDRRIDRSVLDRAPRLNVLTGLPLKRRWAAYWFLAILTAFFYLLASTGVSGAVQFIYAGY